jgi:hypothetical protein
VTLPIRTGAVSRMTQIDALAEVDVEAVGAVKRRFDQHIGAQPAEQPCQLRRHGAAPIGRHRVVLVHGVARPRPQPLQLGIDAAVPLARRHFFALGPAHGPRR